MDSHNDEPVLVGRFDVPLDASGSFLVPEEWRFMMRNGGDVCLVLDLHEKCLLLLTKKALDDEVALLKRSHDLDAPIMLDQITKNAHVVSVAGDGRIVIPIALRTQVGITSSATLLGSVRVIKVWATDVLAEKEKEEPTWDCIEAAMKK